MQLGKYTLYKKYSLDRGQKREARGMIIHNVVLKTGMQRKGGLA